MSRIDQRLERDFDDIADAFTPTPSTTAWAALRTRIAEQADEPEMEIIMLQKNEPAPRRIGTWVLGAAAVVILIVGTIVLLTRGDDDGSTVLTDDPDQPEVVADPEPEAESSGAEAGTETGAGDDTAEIAAAQDLAQRFMDARNAYDGDTVRSLVADDVVVAGIDFVETADDYLALADFERVTGNRFLDVACNAGSPDRVVCSYTAETAVTQALGVGPYLGNSFLFEIADGGIQQVNHNLSNPDFMTDAVAVFRAWVNANHLDDVAAMYRPGPVVGGDDWPQLTPESITLWETHTAEFVAEQSGS